MRIMSLDELLIDLRAEIRVSANVAHGVQTTENYKVLLRRIQEELYLAYDWPALKITRTKDIPAGVRYHEYPDKITFEGVQTAWAVDGGNTFQIMSYGIGPEQLNDTDSDADERSFPVSRWQHYLSPVAENVNQNMFEVWPIPDQDTKVRFYGKRALNPLIDGDNTCTLDGPLIILHAAAEILAAQKQEDASLKLQKAQDRFRLLKLRQTAADNRPINMSGGRQTRPRPGIDYIPTKG